MRTASLSPPPNTSPHPGEGSRFCTRQALVHGWDLEITVRGYVVEEIRAVPSSSPPPRSPSATPPPWWPRFVRELERYRQGCATDFRWVPLAWERISPHDRRVLFHLQHTAPWGTTLTYGELARAVGTSPRAVGGSLRRNPWVVVVPCHRVVAARGLGGFAPGVVLKHRLLTLEGVHLPPPKP